jgi:hypothetical protein
VPGLEKIASWRMGSGEVDTYWRMGCREVDACWRMGFKDEAGWATPEETGREQNGG